MKIQSLILVLALLAAQVSFGAGLSVGGTQAAKWNERLVKLETSSDIQETLQMIAELRHDYYEGTMEKDMLRDEILMVIMHSQTVSLNAPQLRKFADEAAATVNYRVSTIELLERLKFLK